MRLNTHNKHHKVITTDNKAYCLHCEEIKKDTSLFNMYSYATQEQLQSQLLEVKKQKRIAEKNENYEWVDQLTKHIYAIQRFIS